MTCTKLSTKVANVFGSFGYLSVIIQWLLFVAIIIFPLLASSNTEQFFLPKNSGEPTSHATMSLPAGIQIALGIAAVIFCLLVVIYAIYAIPRSIGRTGRKITQASAATVINHVHKDTPLSAEQKAHITLSITWTMKIIIIVLPLALLFLPLDASVDLTRPIVTTIGVVCASFSIFWFGLQYIIATLARTEPKNIW